jgi:hypothetical protein
MSKLQEKPSALTREYDPALQKMKFINFFLCLWVIFALLDPDRIRIQALFKKIKVAVTSKYLIW